MSSILQTILPKFKITLFVHINHRQKFFYIVKAKMDQIYPWHKVEFCLRIFYLINLLAHQNKFLVVCHTSPCLTGPIHAVPSNYILKVSSNYILKNISKFFRKDIYRLIQKQATQTLISPGLSIHTGHSGNYRCPKLGKTLKQ